MNIRAISGFTGYFVSDDGVVFSNKSGNMLAMRPSTNNSGYLVARLFNGGIHVRKLVHRLVLSTFCDKIVDDSMQCNHIDGNKLNNCFSNLEWVSASDNIKHAYRHLGMKSPFTGVFGKDHPRAKPIVSIDIITGLVVKQYACAVDAEADGFNRSKISDVVNNRRKQHGGLHWKFAAE